MFEIVVLRPYANPERVERKELSLEEAQEIVGGYVEMVRLTRDKIMLVDEEGLLKRLPYNIPATVVAGRHIVGTAIVCNTKAFR